MIALTGMEISMVFNLPVLLTWLRIAFIPLLVFLFYLDKPWAALAAATVFGVAGLTDWADGYLARLWQQVAAHLFAVLICTAKEVASSQRRTYGA